MKQGIRPTSRELELELKRERYIRRYQTVLRSTIFTLITVAAAAVLLATIWMPVLQIYGNSMAPTLEEGEIVLSLKMTEPEQGEMIAFYSSNKILVKRVIAREGDWVDMDSRGNMTVNGEMLNEPYLKEKSTGLADVEFPCQVPEGHVFVLGDHRETSVDSRNSAVGFVSREQIVGKIVFRIWPLKRVGWIRQEVG